MNDSDMENKSREAKHGAEMQIPMEDPKQYHCHDCWKYTDDLTLKRDTINAAMQVLVNGGTLDVRNSDAFKAADKYLTQLFAPQSMFPGFK